MEAAPHLSGLPPEQRLALAYATARNRDRILGLFAFDARCAAIVRAAREPLLGQMQLAWWREQLERRADERPAGEPLLALLRSWHGEMQALVNLAEGWERLLGEPPLDSAALDGFVTARADAWAALARLAGHAGHEEAARLAGRAWALADLAARLGQAQEIETVRLLARGAQQPLARLPRDLRPLTILHGLARRQGGAGPLLEGPAGLAVAIRLGLFGR